MVVNQVTLVFKTNHNFNVKEADTEMDKETEKGRETDMRTEKYKETSLARDNKVILHYPLRGRFPSPSPSRY